MRKRHHTHNQALAAFMTRSGLDQVHLAMLVGASQSHISRVMRGKTRPSLELLKALSKVTKIPAGVLLDECLRSGHVYGDTPYLAQGKPHDTV